MISSEYAILYNTKGKGWNNPTPTYNFTWDEYELFKLVRPRFWTTAYTYTRPYICKARICRWQSPADDQDFNAAEINGLGMGDSQTESSWF